MADAQASLEIDQGDMGALEQEESAQQPGALPEGAQGPYSSEEQRVHERFARVKAVAARLSPQNRQRWLEEERARMQQGALLRARKKVAEGVQDRFQHGGFNFLDETEPNPAIEARVEQLMQALDTDQIDPIKAAETEASILEAVRNENQRRLARRRGTQMIEKELTRAVDSGNPELASRLETLHAMWGTGELQADDLVDRMFEAQNGRKTARASAPNPFDVRKEAMRLWETYEKGPPTEDGLQRYMELLVPKETAMPGRREVVAAATAVPGARGTEPDPRNVTRGTSGSSSASPARRPGAPEPSSGELAAMKGSARARSGRATVAKKAEGGLPPRPWPKLKPAEQKQAEKDLLAVAKKGGDMRAALAGIGISDPDSLPRALVTKLLAAVKATGKRPSMAEALKETRPGSGLGPGGS